MGTIAEKLAYAKQARDEIVTAIVDKGVNCPSGAPFCTFDDYIAQISGGSECPPVSVLNCEYIYSSAATSHTRTYEGTAGTTLILLLLHRSDVTVAPTGWEYIGVLSSSYDANDGLQKVCVYKKTCVGSESFSYELSASSLSYTWVIELENASDVYIVDECTVTDAKHSSGLTCVSKSNNFAIWVATSVYIKTNTYVWTVSDSNIWQLSTGSNSPRIGAFVDTREGRNDFTLKTGLTSSSYYHSCLCLNVKPATFKIDYSLLSFKGVGGLQCENLVLNNFSSGVYAYIDKAFLPGSSAWEIVIKATLPTLGSYMSLTGGYGNYFYFPELDITSAGKLQCCLSYSGSGWGAYLAGSTALTAGTTYWFKLEFTGTAYNTYISTDGVTYTLEATATTTDTIYQNSSNTKVCLGASNKTQPFTNGKIDLKESYIKIDNELFWGIAS